MCAWNRKGQESRKILSGEITGHGDKNTSEMISLQNVLIIFHVALSSAVNMGLHTTSPCCLLIGRLVLLLISIYLMSVQCKTLLRFEIVLLLLLYFLLCCLSRNARDRKKQDRCDVVSFRLSFFLFLSNLKIILAFSLLKRN